MENFLTDPSGTPDFGGQSVFDKSFRKGVQERGHVSRTANVSTHKDILDGGADNDLLTGDNASIVVPYKAGVPSTQTGAFTSRFDIKALIKDFGHALPGTPLTKPLVIATTNITPPLGSTSGADALTGGLGNDILLGTKADALGDTSGVNFVETDGSQRNRNRFKIGGDLQIGPSIRKFLASLAADPTGLKLSDGKGGTFTR
jgi:hypothetical protein